MSKNYWDQFLPPGLTTTGKFEKLPIVHPNLKSLAFGALIMLYTALCVELGAYAQKLMDEAKPIRPLSERLHEGWVCSPYSK